MIRARQTCFCGLLRSRMIDCKRTRSAGVTSMDIPLRMPHNRTTPHRRKPYSDSSVRCYPLDGKICTLTRNNHMTATLPVRYPSICKCHIDAAKYLLWSFPLKPSHSLQK